MAWVWILSLSLLFQPPPRVRKGSPPIPWVSNHGGKEREKQGSDPTPHPSVDGNGGGGSEPGRGLRSNPKEGPLGKGRRGSMPPPPCPAHWPRPEWSGKHRDRRRDGCVRRRTKANETGPEMREGGRERMDRNEEKEDGRRGNEEHVDPARDEDGTTSWTRAFETPGFQRHGERERRRGTQTSRKGASNEKKRRRTPGGGSRSRTDGNRAPSLGFCGQETHGSLPLRATR